MDQVAEGSRPPAGPTPGPEEAKYRCPDCLDNLVTERELTRFGDRCTVAWFCDCERGRRSQAGYWFDQLYPWGGDRRHESGAGEDRYREYLAARPLEKRWLVEAVDHLRVKYEQERKRRLDTMKES